MASGSEIFGKYHLLDKIATGGMAEVYRAKSYGVAGFEKTLVIKKILPNLASDKSFIEMFIDEAKIASALSHINIVQIFDLGEQAGEYFIAMEFIDGVDLKTLLDKAAHGGKPMVVNLGAYIITEVAKGLDYAHRRKDGKHQDLNIVHRDVSPHNIMISYAGEVKITDFGIARAASRITHTRSGIIRGKFAYMSPEQARGEQIDRRSDIFALGVVLWEILTGLRLFKAKNDLETLKRVQTLEVEPPSMHNPDVDAELDRIVLKALERDSNKRYKSGSELYEDLSAYLFSAGQKVGPTELAGYMAYVLVDQLEDEERASDFDHFVSALHELDDSVALRSHAEVSIPEDPVDPEIALLEDDENWELDDFEAQARADSSGSGQLWEPSAAEAERAGQATVSDGIPLRVTVTENDQTLADGASEPAVVPEALARSAPEPDAFDFGGVGPVPEPELPLSKPPREDTTVPPERAEEARLPSEETTAPPEREEKSLPTGGSAGWRRAKSKAGVPSRPTVPPPAKDKPSREGTRPVTGERPPVLRLGELPFVGRREEIKQMKSLLGHVARGDGQIIALEGPEGVGKTRVMQELQTLAEELSVAVYRVAGAPELTEVPYGVVRAVLRAVVGASATDAPDVLRERIERLTQLGLTPVERHFVGSMFGLDYIGSIVDEFEERDRARVILYVFDKILAALAKERPLILIVDNLDLADEMSRAAIDHVALGIGSVPLLVLVATRSDAEELLPKAAAKGEIHRVHLAALNRAARLRLLQALLKTDDVPEPVAEVISRTAGGNPLQLIGVTRYLIDEGHLQLIRGRATIEEAVEVPPTIAGLAREALLRLGERPRRLLAVMAAWGGRSSDRLLERLEEAGVSNLPAQPTQAASKLAEAGYLVRLDDGYIFAQRAYAIAANEVFAEEAQDIHRTAATIMEREQWSRPPDHAPRLHYCWMKAGDRERAWFHLDHASEAMIREGGGGSLLDPAHAFLDTSDAPRLRAKASLLVAALAAAAGPQRADEAREALDAARDAADAVEGTTDIVLAVRIEKARAALAAKQGKFRLAADGLAATRQLLQDHAYEHESSTGSLSHLREITEVEVELARAWREAGELNRALRRCREALASAEELREAPLLGTCHEELARIHERLDQWDRAARQWDLAMAIWKKIGRRRALQRGFEARGLMELEEGSAELAKDAFREAHALADEASDIEAVARSLHLLGRATIAAGGLGQGQTFFRESLPHARRFHLDSLVRLNEVYLATVRVLSGEVQEGIRELEAILARWEREAPDDRMGLLHAELQLGNAYKTARRVGPTNKHYVRALKLARELKLNRYVRVITREMKESF